MAAKTTNTRRSRTPRQPKQESPEPTSATPQGEHQPAPAKKARGRNGYNIFLSYIHAFVRGRDHLRGGPHVMKVGGGLWTDLPQNRKAFWQSLSNNPQIGTSGTTSDDALDFVRHIHQEMRPWIQERRQKDGYVSDDDGYDWEHPAGCDAEANKTGAQLPYDKDILQKLEGHFANPPQPKPVAAARDTEKETQLFEEAINRAAEEKNMMLGPAPWRVTGEIEYQSKDLSEWLDALYYFQTDDIAKEQTEELIAYLGRLFVNDERPGSAYKKLYKKALADIKAYRDLRDGSAYHGDPVPPCKTASRSRPESGKAKATPKDKSPAKPTPTLQKHVLKVEAAGATTVDETLAMPPVHPDQGSSSGSSVPAIDGEFDGQNVANVHHNSPIKELTTNSLDEERHETPEPSMRGPARNMKASDVRQNLPPSRAFKLLGCKMDPIPLAPVPAAPQTGLSPVPRTVPAASGSRQIAPPSASGPIHGSQQVSPKSHGVEYRPNAADPKTLAGLAPTSTPTKSPQNSARAHGPRPVSSASSDPGARAPAPPPSAGSSTAAAIAAPPVTALAPSELQLNLLPNPSIPKLQAEHVPTGEPPSHRSVNALHTQLDPTRVNTRTARASVPISRLPEVPSSLLTRPRYEEFLRYHRPKRYTFNDLAEDVYKARASQDAPPAGESSRAASSTTGISASGTPSGLHTLASGETSASLSSGVAAHLSDLDLPPTLAVGISDDLFTFGSTGEDDFDWSFHKI